MKNSGRRNLTEQRPRDVTGQKRPRDLTEQRLRDVMELRRRDVTP